MKLVILAVLLIKTGLNIDCESTFLICLFIPKVYSKQAIASTCSPKMPSQWLTSCLHHFFFGIIFIWIHCKLYNILYLISFSYNNIFLPYKSMECCLFMLLRSVLLYSILYIHLFTYQLVSWMNWLKFGLIWIRSYVNSQKCLLWIYDSNYNE